MKNKELLNAFANPARMLLTIVLPDGWQQKRLIAELFDSFGFKMQQSYFISTEPVSTLILHVKPGTYFLQLTNQHSGEIETKKVLVN